MATDHVPRALNKQRPETSSEFWLSSLRAATRGTASFANDWQWLFGTPLLVGLAVGVGNSLPGSRPSVTTGYAWADALAGAAVAFVTTWVVAFVLNLPRVIARYYLAEKERADAAERTLLPELKCTFDSDDAGCIRTGTITTSSGMGIRADYYRIKVVVTGSRVVTGCRGRLLSIALHGQPVAQGESLVIPFAPSEDADSTNKALHPKVPEYLDFMIVTEHNQLLLPLAGYRGPSSIDFSAIFQQHGEYRFRIVVTNDQGASTEIETSFHWRGHRETVEARQADKKTGN